MNQTPHNESDVMPAVEHPFKEMWRMFFRNKAALIGLGMLSIVVFMALAGPMLYSIDPFDIVWAPMSPPGEGG